MRYDGIFRRDSMAVLQGQTVVIMCAKHSQKASALSSDQSDENFFAGELDHQIGLGVDIVEIDRMRAILQRTPRFRQRVFTADEQAYCESSANSEIHYATRFAAKEAVLKALGTGFGWGTCDPRNVEVRRTSQGRPFAVLHGPVREIALAQRVKEIPLSLSYTHTEAVACALAITDESTAPIAQEDPLVELSRQFKELRGMLDELDAPVSDAEEGDT